MDSSSGEENGENGLYGSDEIEKESSRLESLKNLVDGVTNKGKFSETYPGLIFDEEMSEYERELREDIEQLIDKQARLEYGEEFREAERKMMQKRSEVEEYVRERLEGVEDEKLEEMNIERTEEGKLKLYHATPVDNMDSILGEGLKKRSETGNYTWGLEGEDGGLKEEKVYLAGKEKVHNIAEKIQAEVDGRSVYIFEVEVEESNLYPDEDSQAYHWVGSMESLSTVGYKGEINWEDMRVVDKKDYTLGTEERQELYEEIEEMDDSYIEDKEEIIEELWDQYREKGKMNERDIHGDYDHLLDNYDD